jgi:PAS domain S-box-containing protein
VTDTRFPRTLADLKPGHHLCCLYETEEEYRAVLTRFLRQGLERGEKALCIVDSVAEQKAGLHSAGTILGYLRDDGLDVEAYLARRQLVFRTHDETYMRTGVFDPDSVMALLQAETAQALREGYSALRVSDEMTWVLSERLTEHEARLGDFLPGICCLVLYQYDRRRWNAAALLNVLRTHPVAIIGTAVYDNPYYIPPAELLGPDPPAAELRRWIQNLAAHQQVDHALRQRTRDLEERAKELRCLFAISNLVEAPGISLDQILQGTVDLMPPAWQYPQVAAARVLVEGRVFETHNFEPTVWKQSSDIVVQGQRIGVLEVCYLETRPPSDEGPFLKEEQSLLNAIAERLGRIIERIRAQEVQRQSEERFRIAAQSASDLIYEWDISTGRLEWFGDIDAQLGYAPGEFPRTLAAWKQSIHPQDRDRVMAALERQLETEAPYGEEYRVRRKDGTYLYWKDRGTALRDEEGKPYKWIGADTDVTERVLARQTLEQRVRERTREIERRRQVAEGLRDILAILNSNRSLDTILDTILIQASQLLKADAIAIYRLQGEDELLSIQASRGLDPEYVADANIPIGQAVTGRAVIERQPVMISDIAALPPDHGLSLDRQRQALLEHLGSQYRALLAVPLKHGETLGAITLYYHAPRDFDKEVELAVTFSDQAALAIQNAQLRTQVEQAAVAAERSRLARDLHDSVTQTLFSASLTAEVLPIVWERHRQEGQQALEELRQLTRGALAEMRTLLLELRPAALMETPLDDLLRQLAEAVIGRARVPVTVKVQGQGALPPDVHVALYRIAQEALNNVAKHAGASQATVRLCHAAHPPLSSPGGGIKGGRAELRISDDGRGFDVNQVSPEHLGLGIMRERAEAIGATLSIESQHGHGTQVVVTWTDTQRTKDDDRTETDSRDRR